MFHPYGQLLLLMYDVRANKKNELIHILASLNKYDDFIVVEAIEVEDQNAIKIDDYFLFFGLGLGSLSPSSIKKLLGQFFLTTVVKR